MSTKETLKWRMPKRRNPIPGRRRSRLALEISPHRQMSGGALVPAIPLVPTTMTMFPNEEVCSFFLYPGITLTLVQPIPQQKGK